MPFRLLPLQEQDAPRCVDIYFAAFGRNAHSVATWPRTQNVHEFWQQMIRDELREPGAHWLKAVPTEDENAIAGFAKWVEPKHGVEPSTHLPTWPAEADHKLADETFGGWAKTRKALMGSKGHWYLEIISTDPKYQGKGAGSLMLQFATRKADQQGDVAYLEAAPDAIALYEKFGFQEVDYVETFVDNERVKGTWYRNSFMIRQPKK